MCIRDSYYSHAVPPRLLQLLLIGTAVALIATSCRVSASDIELNPITAASASTLPAIGPVPNQSHWHAAYIVRVCDDVLDPFDTDNDPLGIHSHNDGLMHVHPFFESSGYEAARLQLFADAMGFQVADGELTVPGAGTWRDGDLCNGVPGRVFVDKWSDPDPRGAVQRTFRGIEEIRYEADGELYQIAFAPADAPPVVPPAIDQLFEVSNLAPAAEPWVEVDHVDTGEVAVWIVDRVATQPCASGFIAEQGTTQCYARGSEPLAPGDVAISARAVELNRSPGIDLAMTPAFRQTLEQAFFAEPTNPVALAVEVDGVVVTVALLSRPPVSDRLVLADGFSVESALALASRFN